MIKTVFFLLLSAGILNAQQQSALYKIEGNGLKKPSYLFGTINFLPKFGYFIPDEVQSAIKESEVFVTKSALSRKARQKFTEAVRIPNNGTVDQYLSNSEQQKLRSIIEKYGGKNQAYDNFYSRLQPIILVTATTALTLQYNIVYPEKELEELAKDNKLKFDNLSDVNEEIEAFRQFPIEDQIEALKYTINNFDDHLKDFNYMVRNYMKEQNMGVVKEETFKATNKSEAFKKVYYDDRSKKWMPEIEKMINSKSTFFALGVPHIIGEMGLVSLLIKEGYTVTPISIDFAPAKTSD